MRRALIPVGSIAFVALLAFAFLPSGGKQTLNLTFSGLPTLENGHFYEGWAVIDGEPWSTGRFNVGPDGALVALDGQPTGGDYDAGIDLAETSLITITLHPPLDAEGNTTAAGVAPHLISGAIADFEAPMSVNGGGALGATFADATAVVSVHDGAFAMADISLPALSGGWEYEAWLEINGIATSLGRFGGAGTATKAEMVAKAEVEAKAAMEGTLEADAKAAMEAIAAIEAKAAMEAAGGAGQ